MHLIAHNGFSYAFRYRMAHLRAGKSATGCMKHLSPCSQVSQLIVPLLSSSTIERVTALKFNNWACLTQLSIQFRLQSKISTAYRQTQDSQLSLTLYHNPAVSGQTRKTWERDRHAKPKSRTGMQNLRAGQACKTWEQTVMQGSDQTYTQNLSRADTQT